MPFTLSHPAAALAISPVLGRFAVPSALAIGTMAPDFPYYAALPIPRITTHSLSSVLWFSLPVGWLAYLVYERALRAPLVALLPRVLRLRIAPRAQLASALAVTLSLVLGAASHVVWDAFTHGTVGAVRELPFLPPLVRAVGQSLSFGVLQYGSTAVGGIALAAYGWLWLRRTPVSVRDPDRLLSGRARVLGRTAVLGASPLVGLAVAIELAQPIRDASSLAWFCAHIAVAGITTSVAVLAAAALWLRWAHGRASQSPGDLPAR